MGTVSYVAVRQTWQGRARTVGCVTAGKGTADGARQGEVRQDRGLVGHVNAWQTRPGWAGLGVAGPVDVKARQTWHGAARWGAASKCMADRARQGRAGPGPAGNGMADTARFGGPRCGPASKRMADKACLGEARLGGAGPGMARLFVHNERR